MRLVWVIGAVLLTVAAVAVWFAFQRPDFVIGLVSVAAAAAIKAAAPKVLKRMPPEEEAEWRAAVRRGQGDEWLRNRNRRRKKNNG